jgi:acyl-CoA reductase-like NAD-dependent aldehyde dehydrogenase
VDDAVAKGAKVLTGGHARGPYFEPTLLTDVTPDMRCYHEETFGPVVTLTAVKNADEAVRLANARRAATAGAPPLPLRSVGFRPVRDRPRRRGSDRVRNR